MQQPDPVIHILIVEDDANLGYLLQENLQEKGFRVTVAVTGRSGIHALNTGDFDLCILDIMLPGEDGFTVAEHLRRRRPELPFIFLTARGMEQDRLHGFELGAEDYMIKPFSFKELFYRLQVILRRHNTYKTVQEDTCTLSLGRTELYTAERILQVNGNRRKLSQREAQLLQLLLRHKGTYLSKSDILNQLWGRDDYFTGRSMDVYFTRIRKLIKEDTSLEIENLYGSGYRIRLKEGV
jgi:two-component system, OmpR family, response regulator